MPLENGTAHSMILDGEAEERHFFVMIRRAFCAENERTRATKKSDK
jgi:hypothetical protein